MLDKMAESVKVIVRCRPMNDREREMGCKNILLLDGERCTCSISNPDDITAPPKTFTFDSVYSVVSTTEQIYNDIVYPLVEGVLEGYNSTVFAYGQTGCGKSHTMQGSLVPASSRGIIPRSFEHIFEAISVVENKKFLVVASYLEIYNEEIRDLLSADCKKKLELKDSPQTGVCVPELTKHAVQNVEECEKLMEEGWKNRSTGSTLMNKDSSRSHSIFTIALEMVSNHNSATIRRGKLNLVDLAGSERQAKTGATGERLKEATKINLSLMALGNVISALVDGKSKHIPYRDSKLTRLLQDSLGGNTKTLMIACLSPASNNYDESLCTLRYANRAKNIKNKPRINEDPKDAMLREYQREIEKLKTMLNQGPIPGSVDEIRTSEGYSSRSESEKLKNDYENEMLRLKQEYEREQNSKKKLQQDMDDLKRHYEEQLESLQKKSQGQLENVSHQQVLERLRKLQASMIGGEKADDKELKEKRLKKKKAAERRLEALASVLSKVNDEDGVMLRVYDDIQEELKAKTETLRKYKQRIRGMEREITDLQSEFENERTDYLETIRRSERQLQLYQQIAEKMVAVLKKECNYANLDEIRQEAVWSDDLERWKLPELIVAKTKLPPAGQNYNGNWMTMAEKVYKANSTAPEDNAGNWNNLSERLSSGSPSESSSIFQRLKREAEDLPANYFKPRRANELLSKAREDASKAFSTWKEYTNKNKLRHLGSGQQIGKIQNPLNLYGNIKSNSAGDADVKYGLNGSWNGNWDDSNSWGDLTKKPLKLEALPLISPIGLANGSGEWEREDIQKFLQSLLEAIDTLLIELVPNKMKTSKIRGWNTKGP